MVAEGFEPVRDAFVRNFEVLGDRGAAVAVYRDGRKVVDLWGGTKDAYGTEAWTRDTAQIVRSATKGVAAAVPLLLHQRGLLDLDAPVASYWPEFKAGGKDRTLVRDLLAHRAGVPALDRGLSAAEAADGVSGPRAVAAQQPFWQPGSEHGYHAQTYSWLLSELVLRATGRTVGGILAEELAEPLGLEFWIGLPDSETHRVGRVAPVDPPEGSGLLRTRPKRNVSEAYADPDSLTRRAFAAIDPLPDENDPAYRAAELRPRRASARPAPWPVSTRPPSAWSRTAPGSSPRRPPPSRARSSPCGPDRVLVVNTRFGPGFMLHGPASPLLSPASFGHPGRGGSLAFADPEAGIGFGYVTNALAKSVTADPRAQALVRALRSAL